MKKLLILSLISTLLIACGDKNYFAIYYGDFGKNIMPTTSTIQPKIVDTLDYKKTLESLESKGYKIIGKSNFYGKWAPRAHAIDHAKKIDAEIIVIHTEYKGDDTINYSYALPTANTTYHSGSVYSGNGGYASYSGTSTSYSTTTVSGSYSVGMYNTDAYFLVKKERINHD